MHSPLKQVDLERAADGELRCDCGKLLARVLHTVLELKCPRCKRVVLIVGGQRFEAAGAPACACAGAPGSSSS